MALNTIQVGVYQINYNCDNCNTIMIKNGSTAFNTYNYICPKCKFTIILDTYYPQIIYSPLGSS